MTALAVPHVVEQIGSYAGFVAVVGLAVLSALYISQARDVRRLREWAGRAPERAAEQAARGVPQPVPGRAVTARPVARQAPGQAAPAGAPAATGAVPGPAPAGAAPGAAHGPAPAGAATGGVPAPAPAAAVPAPATPGGAAQAAGAGVAGPAEGSGDGAAGTDGDGVGGGPGEGSAGPNAEPADPKPDADAKPSAAPAGESGEGAEAEPAADAAETTSQPPDPAAGSPPEVAPVPVATGGAKDDDDAPARSLPAGNGAPAGPPPRAPRPTPSLPRRAAPLPASRPSQTAIPPRPGAKRAGRRGPDPRYIALALVGVLVVGAGAAIGIPKLLEEDDAAPATREPARTGATSSQPAAAPDEITVSVLNGTTVPGLAAQVGDQVENEGFVLGNVTNAAEQQRADSVVMYAPGHTRDARLVARRLRLSRSVEPIDPDSRGLAGDATVVVLVGQDQTR